MKNVYLDYSATTPVKEQVVNEMIPYFTEYFGNPSSLYTPGLEAKEGLITARNRVAEVINSRPEEIYFTSCGTESDNWVLEALPKHLRIREITLSLQKLNIMQFFTHASIWRSSALK